MADHHANNQAKCVCYTVELSSNTFLMNVSRPAALLHFICPPSGIRIPPCIKYYQKVLLLQSRDIFHHSADQNKHLL